MCLQWGNKWALQTVHSNDTTEDEFDANIDSVVWPEGWAVEKVCMRIGSGRSCSSCSASTLHHMDHMPSVALMPMPLRILLFL
jgi:hypothetical protein